MPEPTQELQPNAPKDTQGPNLLMRFVPQPFVPHAQLARLDRPIGTWLLFLPCLWGMALAGSAINSYPPLSFIALFAIGALVMRGAGCTFNDIADREIDAKVDRTALRPLPSGRISVVGAWGFLLTQAFIGLLVLLQFNWFTVALCMGSLVLVALYPFMKRVTYWPQFFLGLTFNWGALVGYSAIAGTLSPATYALYAAGVFWTLGYDTIYAHQDREDDALIGVRSTALLFGRHTGFALIFFYGGCLAALALAGYWAELTVLFWVGLGVAGYHLIMQIIRLDIDDGARCLALFRSNRDTGLIIAAALLLGVF